MQLGDGEMRHGKVNEQARSINKRRNQRSRNYGGIDVKLLRQDRNRGADGIGPRANDEHGYRNAQRKIGSDSPEQSAAERDAAKQKAKQQSGGAFFQHHADEIANPHFSQRQRTNDGGDRLR